MVVGWNARAAQRRAYVNALPSRLETFETFCVPSVLNQFEPPDHWLLGFAAMWRDQVSPALNAVGGHSWIRPVWQHDTREPIFATFRRELLSLLQGSFSHVITTRLDNDDAINRWFTHHLKQYSAAVVHHYPELDDFGVTFPFGAHYHGGDCRIYTNPTNHFISRIQTAAHFRATEMSTVLVINHNRLLLRGEGRRVFLPITTDPMWLEVVHGGNASHSAARANLLKFKRPQTTLARFGVSADKSARCIRNGRTGLGYAILRSFKRARRFLRRGRPSGR
ncbi:MAG TPA: glycosyltransferase [Propylenella sp.]|nr:glycosyltransferase [Propylenella sp.]